MNTFNFESKTAWWVVEPDINIVIFNGNVMHQIDNGKRDSIGRTYEAFLTYKDKRFLDAILSCWKFDGKYWRGKRYPVDYPTEVPMSRDHTYYTIFALNKAVEWNMIDKDFYEHFISHQPIKLSDFAYQSPSMYFWLKLLQGKKIGYLYYIISYILLKSYIFWNRCIYKATGTGELVWEQHQDDFMPILIFPRAKVLDKIAGLLFPNYALMLLGNQLKFVDNEWWKIKLKKIAIPLVPKFNYLGKIIFDHPDGVTWEEVMSYKPMVGDRWADILNPWINYGRNMHILDESCLGENELDKDYLISVWKDKYEK